MRFMRFRSNTREHDIVLRACETRFQCVSVASRKARLKHALYLALYRSRSSREDHRLRYGYRAHSDASLVAITEIKNPITNGTSSTTQK